MNKLIFGMVLFSLLITIQQVSGCSLAAPTNTNLRNIRGTEDPNRYLVSIQNTNYESQDAILDLSNQRITGIRGDDLEVSSTFGTPTSFDYTEIITQENNMINWVISRNSTTIVNATFEVNTTSIIRNWSFISDSLNIAYLVYFGEEYTGYLYLVSMETSQVIYYEPYDDYFLPSFTVYDQDQLLVASLGGGDCREAIYLRYDAFGFHEIQTIYSWQSSYFDTRSERLIISEFDFDTESTEMTIIKYKTGFEYSFSFTAAELGMESETSDIPASSATSLDYSLDFPILVFIFGLVVLIIPFAKKRSGQS